MYNNINLHSNNNFTFEDIIVLTIQIGLNDKLLKPLAVACNTQFKSRVVRR